MHAENNKTKKAHRWKLNVLEEENIFKEDVEKFKIMRNNWLKAGKRLFTHLSLKQIQIVPGTIIYEWV